MMQAGASAFLVLSFWAVLQASAGATMAAEPLTEPQVACEERQLGRLTYRAKAEAIESNVFLWRASASGGLFRGLTAAGRMQDPITRTKSRREDQLAFDLILSAEADFLNPARKRLPQATLARRETSSSVGPPVFGYASVSFDLALEVPDPTNPQLPLVVNGLTNPGLRQADRAARSLLTEDLLSACHDQVSAFDLKMFEILARTVRATCSLVEPELLCNLPTRFKSYIFRGAAPNTYRMNILRYERTCFDDDDCSYGEGGVALLFRINLDTGGRLVDGDVQVLPVCTTIGQTGCGTTGSPDFAVYVMPPLRPSVDQQGPAEFARSSHVNIRFDGSEDNILYATINWADLLRDTAWNEGTGVAVDP